MVGTTNHISFLLFPRIYFPSCPGIIPDPWLGKLILLLFSMQLCVIGGRGERKPETPGKKLFDQSRKPTSIGTVHRYITLRSLFGFWFYFSWELAWTRKSQNENHQIQNKIKCEIESYGMPRIASGLFSTVTPLQKCSLFDTELYTIFPLNIWSKTEANVELLGLATLKEFDGKTFWTRKREPWKSCTAFLWQKKQKTKVAPESCIFLAQKNLQCRMTTRR